MVAVTDEFDGQWEEEFAYDRCPETTTVLDTSGNTLVVWQCSLEKGHATEGDEDYDPYAVEHQAYDSDYEMLAWWTSGTDFIIAPEGDSL